MHRSARLVALLVVSVTPSLAAQQRSTPAPLTVERIFASGEFRGERPPEVRWLDDSTYTTIEGSTSGGGGGGGGGSDIVRYDAPSGNRSVLVASAQLIPRGQEQPLEIEDYEWSADHKRLLVFTNSARVWRANTRGDFWVLDISSHALRKLGGAAAKPSTLQFAKFSPDGARVAYVREHNLYVETLATGAIVPLTRDGSTTTINGTFDWVYEEELYMRDGFRWSPDGRRIAYWQLDAKGVRDFLLINNTDSLYSFVTPIQYPKAGTTNSAARIGVVSASGGPTTWLKVPGDPRNNYLARMDWAGNATELAVQQLNRRQTQNTLWFANASTGAVRQVLVERDSAWLDIWDDYVGYGPGPSLHWFDSGASFLWLSERDGWRHAYLVGRDGSTRLVTPGDYDVMRVVHVDAANRWLYFAGSPSNATQLSLWRVKLDGKSPPERVTPDSAGGTHGYEIAPGGNWAVHSASSWGTPPTVDIVRLPGHTVARTLVTNSALKERLSHLAQGKAEFFRVDVGDGVSLDAWMMKPPGFDSTRTYPILFQVYGEPAAQTVRDAWGGSSWLWHLMLTQQGYIVASVDNRGTPAPRGRAWRKALLNQFGTLRVHDQSTAARVIARRPYIDSARVGVWGWSGGGSSTLHLMFRAPDVYRMGMSVAPVPDVRNYDTIYQERYVGLPSTDSLAYRDASAIHFVDGLKGDLLVVHGSGDDNVHFQGTEQLIDAMIAAGKAFSMMEYPNRTHGIYEGRGTTVHLYNLLTRYLHEHLPTGAAIVQ